jgi:hypothetical protein
MPLDYKTLPAQWKKAKPLTMGTTGVGAALKNVTGFNWKDVTEVDDAVRWKSHFEVAVKGLDSARDKEPIKSNAKVKEWVVKLLHDLLRDAHILEQIQNHTLVYDAEKKKWGFASENQLSAVEQLESLRAAWLKLKPETRKAIMKLVKAG